jgi:predicted aldo/keto reductase-like oxidoreductase
MHTVTDEPRRFGKVLSRIAVETVLCLAIVIIISACASGPAAMEISDPVPNTAEPAASESEPHIRQYNPLGNTGLMVSDIGFGAGATTDPAVVQYALDMGINYFDTAEGYGQGRSEKAIGAVAAEHRDKMIICSKLAMNGQTTQAEIYERVNGCLERLQTDYIDILMIHTGNKDAVDNPEIFKAFEQLKADKKIHFTGISNHGPNLTTSLKPIVESRKVDVILCSYDPVTYPDLPDLIAKSREKGIGLIGMKVLSSARGTELEEFTSGSYPFHLAAVRWALKTSHMDTLIPSINVMDQIDDFISVSGYGK